MKTISKFLLFPGILLCFLLFPAQSANADTLIADGAGILSSEEQNQLESSCDEILERYSVSVYIITNSEIGKQDDYDKYMKNIAENESSPNNLVLLFVSTKKKNSVTAVYTYGSAKDFLTEKRCGKILKKLDSSLAEKDYCTALKQFLEDTSSYLGNAPFLDLFIFSPLFQLFFCLVLACLFCYWQLHRLVGKKSSSSISYLDRKQAKRLGSLDIFTHTTVTESTKKGMHRHPLKKKKTLD